MRVNICQVVMRSFHMGMTTPTLLQIPRGPHYAPPFHVVQNIFSQCGFCHNQSSPIIIGSNLQDIDKCRNMTVAWQSELHMMQKSKP